MASQRRKGPIKATLLMAAFGYREADADDIEFTTVVSQIEEQHDVVIDIDSENQWLEIHALTKDSAAKAMDTIRSALKIEPDSTKIWHPNVLMGPVKVGKAGFKALLDHSSDGARPYMSPEAGPATTSQVFNDMDLNWQNDFREKLFRAVKVIRSTSGEMRMRVQLGTLLLQEWKKSVTEYTYSDLETVIKRLGARGTFSFSQVLGKVQLAHNLLAKVYASPEYFEPVGTRVGKLEHIKPTHTLILTTSNLRIETEVIHVQESDTATDKLRLSTAKGFRRERRSRAVEIATSCPEHKYDWNLTVHTRVPVTSLPFSHDDIAQHSRFTSRDNPNEFPDIHMRKDFAQDYQVEQIIGKTSWVFKIRDSSYAIEVAIYNILASTEKEGSKLKEGGCGVDVFRPGWDELLSAHNIAAGPRQLSEECKELFPLAEKKLGDKDGVEALVRRVREIHDLVSVMDDQPPVRLSEPVASDPELVVSNAEPVVSNAEPVVSNAEEEDLLLSWD